MSKSPYAVCFYCADQNPQRDRSRGITRYTYGLLSHLRDAKMIRLMALVSKSSFTIPEGIERYSLPFATDRLVGRLLADHLHPLIGPRTVSDIWHYPKGFLPVGFQANGKRVGTVADVMLQFDADHHPESRSGLTWAYWLGMLKHSIQNLDLILTVSEFSKRAILQFCQRHRLKCPPIIVTYEGVEVLKSDGTMPGCKEDYVVHLASKLPYKATTWLLEQWSCLAQTKRDLPMLRLVGDLDDRATALLSKMTNVSLVPPLPRAQLEEVISKSRALLLPSEIEGFGIPAVEGYLLGTPVAYAKGTALEEIVGPGSPGGFDRDRDSFEAALNEALNMDRGAVEKKATDLKRRYNWNDCVRRTLEAYSSVLSSSRLVSHHR
jgi:glycosyltransferase involved in cell wall biosynthesis